MILVLPQKKATNLENLILKEKRPQSNWKVVSYPIRAKPLLHHWAQLAGQGSVVACRLQHWVRPSISLLPQWPAQHLLVLQKQASRSCKWLGSLCSDSHIVSLRNYAEHFPSLLEATKQI